MSPAEVEIFIEAARKCTELPEDIRLRAQDAVVVGVGVRSFDESYITFLDEQIQLGSRGPEWTERLRRRREGLRNFCNVPLISGRIPHGASNIWLKVDPQTRTVVFWEDYENPEL